MNRYKSNLSEENSLHFDLQIDQETLVTGTLNLDKMKQLFAGIIHNPVLRELSQQNNANLDVSNKNKGNKKQENRLIPVTKWNDYYDWPSINSLRNLIFHEKTNGFSHCIRRVGGRVLIDESAFFEWVKMTNPQQK